MIHSLYTSQPMMCPKSRPVLCIDNIHTLKHLTLIISSWPSHKPYPKHYIGLINIINTHQSHFSTVGMSQMTPYTPYKPQQDHHIDLTIINFAVDLSQATFCILYTVGYITNSPQTSSRQQSTMNVSQAT